MPDSTLAGLTAATAATGGLYYGTQGGADRKFTITAAGAAIAEAADAAAQRTAMGVSASGDGLYVVAFKNITVLTTGAPADIASLSLPSWLTRYRVASAGVHLLIAETASGTLADSRFFLRDAASGGGAALTASISGPASTTVMILPTAPATDPQTFQPIGTSTSGTLYLRQTANSANAGTVSVYLTLVPLL